MIRKYRNIISVFLLFAFLTPSLVKLGHHQKHIVSEKVIERHLFAFREKCPICDFDFSVFLNAITNVVLQKDNPTDKYCNNYQSVFYSTLPYSLFLLRAPPTV
jgi:hypothetical protein